MARRQYSTRDFFRQMPKALLGRYFTTQGVLGDQDFATMKEGDPAALFEAWQALPDDRRRGMEADFREIAELGDKTGFRAILDEAAFHLSARPEALEALREKLAELPDHPSRAMVTFLDHAELWKGALLFHHADGLAYWRKRKNLPRLPAAVDKASLELLAEKIKAYFRATDGRGRNCVVEPYRRGDRDYYFAFPEDHAQRGIEWVDGRFDARPHNPAFEIVFVYSQPEGTLDLNARGLGQSIEALQTMFAQAILKLDGLPPDPRDDRVYRRGGRRAGSWRQEQAQGDPNHSPEYVFAQARRHRREAQADARGFWHRAAASGNGLGRPGQCWRRCRLSWRTCWRGCGPPAVGRWQ